MNQEPRIDILAAALADRARCRMVAAAMDGRAYSAKELAFRAEVSPQTASFHLKRLTDSGILDGYRRGRHHYFYIGDSDMAGAVEALMAAAPQTHLRHLPPRAHGRFVLARSCWTHLAGKLAVALAERLSALEAIEFRGGDFVPGPRAGAVFGALGMTGQGMTGPAVTGPALAHPPMRGSGVADGRPCSDPIRLRPGQPWAKPCLDWTERRFHLAGAVGRQLLDHFLAAGWLLRSEEGRALQPSATGEAAFRDRLGIDLDLLRGAVEQERAAAE